MFRKIVTFAVCVFAVLCVGGVSVYAQSVSSTAIAQGFKADGTIEDYVAGALVSSKGDATQSVQLATTQSQNQLVGIVDKQPLVSLGDIDVAVQVVIGGTVSALVSDINGPVKAGDKITISPIEGVGMRATANVPVVGTVLSSMDNTTAKEQRIKDSAGREQTVRLGRVQLQVNVSYYQSETNGLVPPFVQGVANSLAGRQVSLVRILVCSSLLLLAFVAMTVLLYTSVRSSIVAIGRNPLAAKAIRRGLLQVGFVVVLVSALALFSGYLVLAI